MIRSLQQIAAERRFTSTWERQITYQGEPHHFVSEAPRVGRTFSAWYLSESGRWVRMVREKSGVMYEHYMFGPPTIETLEGQRRADDERASRF